MGNAEVKLLVVVEKGCGLMVREEYCLLTCVVESGTGVAAWVPDHVGNWVVCAQSQLGNWVHWSWGSCSAMNSLPLSEQHQELPGSPEWEIWEKGCGHVWESLAHSPQMTRSG
jgi:hypothetical protein